MGKLFGGGGDEAKKAREEAAREQAKQEQIMKNQREVEAATIDKQVADVAIGGTDMPDTILADMQRRKRASKSASSISDTASQLGVG